MMYYRDFEEKSGKAGDYGLKRIPDYTELAYKEAVGKLRYFLSGNYAPSYRSYGGSASIKNLDDSEEVDKKYPSLYATKPRLTAKYTQLYADSLDSYHPYGSGRNSASKPTAPAQETAANPEVVHFIQKQEEYIEQLERESQYCRDELNNLLGKVKEVISENEHLHEAQKNKIISRMFDSYGGSETDDLEDVGDSTGLDSDAKVTPSKIRRATKSVRSTRLEGPNIVFESRISELEAQLAQAQINHKKIQDENNENKRKLAEGLVDSSCLDGFKRQIDNLQRDKSSLESQIAKLKVTLEQREQNDSELGSRLKRGSDVVEQQLRDERNNLEAEVRRLKEELDSQRGKVRELCGEGARRAIQERSAAQQRYTAHLDELAHDLAAQYDNVSKLQLDLERQRRDEQDVKRELSMKSAAIEELKMELKSKTATLQADLAQAHAEKASMEEELASARLAIERNQRQAKHETNRLNSEIQSLRQRLDRADADLVHSRRENLRLSEEIAKLEKDLKLGNLTPHSPVKDNKEKELSSMLESMENKHAHTVAELEGMIQSQNSLMDKLTGECRLLTDKLDDASRRHKQEMAALQRQVEGISLSFQQPVPTSDYNSNNYQAPAPHTVNSENVRPPATSSGNENTRTDTARDPKIMRQSSNSSIRGYGNDPSRSLKKQLSKDSFSNGATEKVIVDNQNYIDNQRQPPDKFEEKLDEATEKGIPKNIEEINPAAPAAKYEAPQPIYSEEPQYTTDQAYNSEQNYYNENQFEGQPEAYTQKTPYNQEGTYEDTDYNQANFTQDYAQEQYGNREYPAQQYTEEQNAGYTEQPYGYSTDPNYQTSVNPNQPNVDPNYGDPVDQNYQAVDPSYQMVDPSQEHLDQNYQAADPNYQSVDPNQQYVDPQYQAVDPSYQTVDPSQQTVDPNYQAVNPNDEVAPNDQETDPNYGSTESYQTESYAENTGYANNSPNKPS